MMAACSSADGGGLGAGFASGTMGPAVCIPCVWSCSRCSSARVLGPIPKPCSSSLVRSSSFSLSLAFARKPATSLSGCLSFTSDCRKLISSLMVSACWADIEKVNRSNAARVRGSIDTLILAWGAFTLCELQPRLHLRLHVVRLHLPGRRAAHHCRQLLFGRRTHQFGTAEFFQQLQHGLLSYPLNRLELRRQLARIPPRSVEGDRKSVSFVANRLNRS